MVRIEIKKVAEGQVALGMEAKEETPDEVLMCAARGFVGVARNLLGPMATNPQFAEEISRGIKGMLLDTEDLKVTRGMEGKEAKLWAEVSRVNTRLKQEMVAASFTVRALPGDLQEDAINILSKTVSEMLGDLTRLMAETGEP